MIDIISYVMGLIKGRKQGTKNVVLDGDGYTYTDSQHNGNVVITEVND